MRHRVLRASLGRWVDPAVAYAAICGDADAAFWLDSGPNDGTGMSYLGLAARIVTEFDGPFWTGFAALAWSSDATPRPRFTLGWFRWLGYELRGETMGGSVILAPATHAACLRIGRAVAIDHRTGTSPSRDGRSGGRRRCGGCYRPRWRIAALMPTTTEHITSRAGSRHPGPIPTQDYLDMIAACKQAIVEGDAYLLCLTTEVSVDVSPDRRDLPRPAGVSPSHHGALLRAGAVSLLSASPEQFLSVSPPAITTSPIKGTRPRGSTEARTRGCARAQGQRRRNARRTS